MKVTVLLLLSLYLLLSTPRDIKWLPVSGQKKIEQTFAKIWKDKTIAMQEIILPDADQKALGFMVRKQTLYRLLIGNKLEGYMYLDKAPSKFDKFDFMVIFSPELTIIEVKILVYREDQGAEIMSSSFLKQFRGKDRFSKFSLGDDIQGISGATISCRSSTNGVKNLTNRIVKLKSNQKL